MIKKLILISLFLIGFFIINYIAAFFFAPTRFGQASPVWMNEAMPERNEAKKRYLNSLNWYERLLIITMSFNGTDSKALVDSSINYYENNKEAFKPGEAEEKINELRQHLEDIGSCTLAGKNGHWEFYTDTFTLFNIKLDEVNLTCANGFE
jgi:hypothetical protein